ncbi:hypothetical protein AB0M79_16480 [Polymorphospora sp. NPDC051019]|uniref:hypothetical protein n=1 Tax=Polymorphospora sp. NPDC051019 TaxID=3155725 RepID=UPI0034476F77
MILSRIRILPAAVVTTLLAALLIGTPAEAAPRTPALSVPNLAWSAADVDASEGWAQIQLTWTVANQDSAATTVRGTVQFRQFVDSTPVGSARTVSYALGSTPAQVWSHAGDVRSSDYEYTFQVPQYGAATAAVWRVTKVTIEDDRGNSRTLGQAALAHPAAQFSVTQLVDGTAPYVTWLTLAPGQPTAVYDDGNGVTLRYRTLVSDEGSGFWKGRVVFAGPQGQRVVAPFAVEHLGGWAPQCGEGNDVPDPTFAWCTVTAVIPAGSPAGAWSVLKVVLTDNAGHTNVLTGVSAPTVRVSRNDVISATGFTVTPEVVDNWRTPKTAELVFTPSGGVGGLASVHVEVSWCAASTTPTIRADGTAVVPIEMGTHASECVITGIVLKDAAGNEAFYGTAYGNADLGLAITRVADPVPPAVLSASLSKTDWTQVELQAGAGIPLTVAVDTTSPAPVTGMSMTIYNAAGASRGGSSRGVQEPADGLIGLTAYPGSLAPGQYTVGFTLTDAAGNRTRVGYPGQTEQPPGGPLVITVVEG